MGFAKHTNTLWVTLIYSFNSFLRRFVIFSFFRCRSLAYLFDGNSKKHVNKRRKKSEKNPPPHRISPQKWKQTNKLANIESWQVILCSGLFCFVLFLLLIVSTVSVRCEISTHTYTHTIRKNCVRKHHEFALATRKKKGWLAELATYCRCESGISVRKLFISNWPTISLPFFSLLLVVTAVGCRQCIRNCNLHV